MLAVPIAIAAGIIIGTMLVQRARRRRRPDGSDALFVIVQTPDPPAQHDALFRAKGTTRTAAPENPAHVKATNGLFDRANTATVGPLCLLTGMPRASCTCGDHD